MSEVHETTTQSFGLLHTGSSDPAIDPSAKAASELKIVTNDRGVVLNSVYNLYLY